MSNPFDDNYTGRAWQSWQNTGSSTRSREAGRRTPVRQHVNEYSTSNPFEDNYRGRRRQRSRSDEAGRTTLLFPFPGTRQRSTNDWSRHQSFGAEDVEDRGRSRSRSVGLCLRPSHIGDYSCTGAESIDNPMFGILEAEHQEPPYLSRYPPVTNTLSFHHFPLRGPDRFYRLIRVLPYEPGRPICCEMIHTCPSWADIRYTALSYTWGDQQALDPILVGYTSEPAAMQPTRVTKNLYDILLHITEMQELDWSGQRWNGWWWIDALCIIQDEANPEKDVQIKNMPNTYMFAAEVVAWIGPGDPITDEAMRYIGNRPSTLRQAATRGSANAHLASFEDDFRSVAFPIREIFRRTYWTRLWILQELALSPNPVLVCGRRELPWKIFVDFATQVAAADVGSSAVLSHIQREIISRQSTWLITLLYRKRKRRPIIAELVFLSQNAQCGKDKKDHIRALLGMVERGAGCFLDPTNHLSPCSIISEATRCIIFDMRDDHRIPERVKYTCEQWAQSSHHSPMVNTPEMQPPEDILH